MIDPRPEPSDTLILAIDTLGAKASKMKMTVL
jgi:hypothetical protein